MKNIINKIPGKQMIGNLKLKVNWDQMFPRQKVKCVLTEKCWRKKKWDKHKW